VLKKIKKKILISIAFGGLLYLSFTIYADFNQVAKVFEKFNWMLLPILLVLSLLNYFTRFLKWDYYLSILKVNVKKVDSLSIFMSGLIMSVTPGKMGELLKSYLVKEIEGTPVSKTAPVIFAERITDFVSLILIGLIGAYIYGFGGEITLAVGIFFLIVLIIIGNKKLALPLIGLIEKINFLKKHIVKIHTAYESSYQLLKPLPLVYMVLLSLVGWFFECLGYHLILSNFGVNNSLMWASFSYALATIAGSITMLPGGLGVTEGSLTFLLIKNGASKEIAVASTFIVRVVTLWFAVLVGIVSVTFYQRRFGKISVETISNN
jgi:glycosyltransferase 2 family protein